MTKHFLASIVLMVLVSVGFSATCKDEGLDLCDVKPSYYASGTCKDGLDLCPKPKPAPKPAPKPMVIGSPESTCDGTDLCDYFNNPTTAKPTKKPAATISQLETTAAPREACVAGNPCAVSGTLLMTIAGPAVEAENVVKDVLASSLEVPKSAIIKADLTPIASSRRLASAAPQSKASAAPQSKTTASSSVYHLNYEVEVPESKSNAEVLDKAAQLPNKLPGEFYNYGVHVTAVTHSSFPVSFDNSATTTLNALQLAMGEAEKRVAGDDNAFLQIIPRVVLIGGPCFIGYLATVPGCKEFCDRSGRK